MADSPFTEMPNLAAQMNPEELMMLLQQRQQLTPADHMNLPYGIGPVTPETIAGRPNPEVRSTTPSPGQNASLALRQGAEDMGVPGLGERMAPFAEAALDYGPMPAQAYMGQIDRAAKAASDATDDPSISNLANAGVQSGMALGSPAMIGGSMLAGFGNALGHDLGVLGGGEAQAAPKKKGQAAAVNDLPGLPPEHQEAYKRAMQRLNAGDFRTGAERRALEGEVAMYRSLALNAGTSSQRLDEEKRRASQGEYDRQVETANASYDREMGRDRRFSETAVGKFYDQMGGSAPFAAAATAGMLGRWGHGVPAEKGAKAVWDKGIKPWAEGAGAAYGMTNLPDIYNAFSTEPDNPQRRALEARGRDLPEGHPLKQKSLDDAARLDKENPVQKAATDRLKDPGVMGGRAVAAGIEGLTAPITHGMAGFGTRVMREKAANKASEAAKTAHRGVAVSAQTPEQRAAAQAAASKSSAEARAQRRQRAEDPEVADWFEHNKGLGPDQKRRAFEERFGESYSRKHLEAIEKGATSAKQSRRLDEIGQNIRERAQQAQGDEAAMWAALAGRGDASVQEVARFKQQLVESVPELANMTPRQINLWLRKHLN